jgi:hypothetical protein
MTYRRPLAAVLVTLVLSACGGSSHRTSSSTATTASTASSQGTTSAPASTANSSTATTASTATTTSHASRPPEVPAGGGHKKAAPRPSVSSGATIPAAFLISSGGALSPSSVAVPPGVSISLGVDNRDHAAHTVSLAGPRPATLHLRAGAGALTIVSGLPKGTYKVLVDGAAKAKLVVGATGGP